MKNQIEKLASATGWRLIRATRVQLTSRCTDVREYIPGIFCVKTFLTYYQSSMEVNFEAVGVPPLTVISVTARVALFNQPCCESVRPRFCKVIHYFEKFIDLDDPRMSALDQQPWTSTLRIKATYRVNKFF